MPEVFSETNTFVQILSAWHSVYRSTTKLSTQSFSWIFNGHLQASPACVLWLLLFGVSCVALSLVLLPKTRLCANIRNRWHKTQNVFRSVRVVFCKSEFCFCSVPWYLITVLQFDFCTDRIRANFNCVQISFPGAGKKSSCESYERGNVECHVRNFFASRVQT